MHADIDIAPDDKRTFQHFYYALCGQDQHVGFHEENFIGSPEPCTFARVYRRLVRDGDASKQVDIHEYTYPTVTKVNFEFLWSLYRWSF